MHRTWRLVIPIDLTAWSFLDYAKVLKMLGNGRLEAELFDEKSSKMLAHIRGKMRKKVRSRVTPIPYT